MSEQEYEDFLKKEIDEVVRFQERIGLDLLVHGEPERNDMVQYFGEQLNGFVFTQNAWVQSYGSRYAASSYYDFRSLADVVSFSATSAPPSSSLMSAAPVPSPSSGVLMPRASPRTP